MEKTFNRTQIFSMVHPLITFVYFLGVIAFAMFSLHPIYVALSFLLGGAYSIFLRGVRAFLKSLRHYCVMVLTIAAMHPFFGGMGLTVLFYLGDRPITREAVFYGICSGVMLVSVIQWFSCYQEVMANEQFLSLFGRRFPVVSMMISMIFRYIPETMRKGKEIATAQEALLGTAKKNRTESVRQGVRLASVLMSWSMESSIETADSMRARGYKASGRSKYPMQRFTRQDAFLLVSLAALILINAVFLWRWVNRFRFYPLPAHFALPVWVPLAYSLLLAFPLLLEGGERIRWMRFGL